jgi:hypothetical protein
MLKEMFKYVWGYELNDEQIKKIWDIKQYEQSFYLQEMLAKKLGIRGSKENRINLFKEYNARNTNI